MEWKTNISVKTTEGRVHIPITLRRGLFQGDSLSPLLLLFMDGLKVFDESQEKLQKKVEVVEDTSSAVGMELGLKKCAVARIVGGKVVQGGSLILATGAAIEDVEYGSTYRYLGVHQLFGAKLAKMKQRIVMEYVGRLRKTWGS